MYLGVTKPGAIGNNLVQLTIAGVVFVIAAYAVMHEYAGQFEADPPTTIGPPGMVVAVWPIVTIAIVVAVVGLAIRYYNRGGD